MNATTQTHTPGPWTVIDESVTGIRNGRHIVNAHGVKIIFAGEEAPLITAPDARLIAASPDLLRQGSALVRFLVENDARWSENQFVLDMQASIAKAEEGKP